MSSAARVSGECGAWICLLGLSLPSLQREQELGSGLQDGLGALHLGQGQVETLRCVKARNAGPVVFEVVQSGKRAVKASCGLRSCPVGLSLNCWLKQFNFEISLL